MRKNNLILFLSIALLLLASCNRSRNQDMEYKLSSEDYEHFIDAFAGDPFDPDLPEDYIGVPTEVLANSDPDAVNELFRICFDFAIKDSIENPRFIYAMARTGYLHGYSSKAVAWLEIAARNNSVGAKAMLAEILFYEPNSREIAERLYRDVVASNYKREDLDELFKYDLQYIESQFNYGQEISLLLQGESVANPELKLISTEINNFLWSNDALWLVEDQEMFLVLRPPLNVENNFGEVVTDMLSNYITSGKKEIIRPKSVQDARRLALMYDRDPGRFMQVYNVLMNASESR